MHTYDECLLHDLFEEPNDAIVKLCTSGKHTGKVKQSFVRRSDSPEMYSEKFPIQHLTCASNTKSNFVLPYKLFNSSYNSYLFLLIFVY